jgi:hypothetical protein
MTVVWLCATLCQFAGVEIEASQGIDGITSSISANNPSLGPLDISHSKGVRINLRRSSCTSCGDLKVEVYSGINPIEVIDLPSPEFLSHGSFATRFYDVPGVSLLLRFSATSGTNSILVDVFGNPN